MSDLPVVRRAQGRWRAAFEQVPAYWRATLLFAERRAVWIVLIVAGYTLWNALDSWNAVPSWVPFRTDKQYTTNSTLLMEIGVAVAVVAVAAVLVSSERWTAILVAWSGGLAKLMVALAVVFTSSATAAWYEQAIRHPGRDPLASDDLPAVEYVLARQYFRLALVAGMVALGVSLVVRGRGAATLRSSPTSRLKSRLLVTGVAVCAVLAYADLSAGTDHLGVQVPFEGTTTTIAATGLLLMLSRSAALRRVGAAAVGFAFAVLSTTWGFLYDNLYSHTRSLVDATPGKTVSAGDSHLSSADVDRLDTLLHLYAITTLWLLVAVALAIVHQHQRRADETPIFPEP